MVAAQTSSCQTYFALLRCFISARTSKKIMAPGTPTAKVTTKIKRIVPHNPYSANIVFSVPCLEFVVYHRCCLVSRVYRVTNRERADNTYYGKLKPDINKSPQMSSLGAALFLAPYCPGARLLRGARKRLDFDYRPSHFSLFFDNALSLKYVLSPNHQLTIPNTKSVKYSGISKSLAKSSTQLARPKKVRAGRVKPRTMFIIPSDSGSLFSM